MNAIAIIEQGCAGRDSASQARKHTRRFAAARKVFTHQLTTHAVRGCSSTGATLSDTESFFLL
ncbi:MAG: hypothetical protein AB7E29_06810 [Xanthobacter sp.]